MPIRPLRPLLAAALLVWLAAAGAHAADAPTRMPAFRHQEPDAWLNSAPIRTDALRGKVVLIDLFTTA